MIHQLLSLTSLLLSIFTVIGFRGVAQTADIAQHNLQGAGRIYDQKAVIRWIPSDAAVWKLGNLHGYRIIRIHHAIISSTPVFTSSNEENLLLKDTLRPFQLAQWQILSDSLPLARTAASLIRSTTDDESQQITSNPGGEVDLFGMAMLLADLDPVLAYALGVGFIDTSIVAGEMYSYQVTINGHPRLTTTIKCHSSTQEKIRPPDQPEAVWGDRVATLSWKANTSDSCYAFFVVERSIDGGHSFESVNALPIVALYTEATKAAPVKYTDSLLSNEQVYHYRIKGITPFGQHGPPSTAVSGKGVAVKISLLPFITSIQFNPPQDEYQISWYVDTTSSVEVSAYEIHEYTEKNAPGRKISGSSLGPDARTFSSNEFKHGHYYCVVALDKGGNNHSSAKKLLLKKDDHPPLPPTGLSTWTDTVGNALLIWSKNTEEDMQGYRVYISNHLQGDYHEITANPVSDTFFLYQYPQNSLQQQLYFSVSAIDLRGNYSQHATPKIIEIPDKIPPSAPVFSHSLAEQQQITICWIHSNSQDVVNHQLQRTIAMPGRENEEWQSLANHVDSPNTSTCFEDIDIASGITYKYRIVVYDASGNMNTSDELHVEALRKRPAPCLLNISIEEERYTGQILLEWDSPLQTEAERYIIYSSAGQESLQSRTTLTRNNGTATAQGRHFRFVEDRVIRNQNYHYQIAAKDKTGQTIDLSPIISITL